MIEPPLDFFPVTSHLFFLALRTEPEAESISHNTSVEQVGELMLRIRYEPLSRGLRGIRFSDV